ncbi:MAG: hypothetical protein KDJ70_20115, partial [Candidatus Competibacteraceae bacterium]|nr:hypothetical protein [Candidatus Competibacteraceae bacterium]
DGRLSFRIPSHRGKNTTSLRQVDNTCYGGGGGGSYAMASTRTDGDAPTSHAGNTGDGEVLMIFNPDPS